LAKMNGEQKYLVTSALPYANGPIHLGHLAGAYLPADIYVRYLRLKGRDVVFICGSDEHGVPITITAEKEGVTPKEVVDRYYSLHKQVFEKMGIGFDNFSRTSLKLHHRTAQEFFLRLYRKGLLREKTIEQFYCPRCRRFLADRYVEGTCPFCEAKGARGDQCEACGKWLEPIQLVDPACIICGSTPVIQKTRHWFLPLGEFQDKIKRWLDTKTHWKPNVINFCYGWFKEGLEDRAVTRDLNWGVPVPLKDARGKVLYVWFDAPIGYISSTKEWAIKTGQPDRWKDYWLDPETKLVHFIGKDNIVFHAVVWPAILMGRGEYILPSEIPANEFLNIEGRKISTSKNYAVWLDEYLEKFPPDPLRYCLAANAPETKDADFSWRDFQARNNSELADIIGNFANRTLAFTERYFKSKVPSPEEYNGLDQEMINRLSQIPRTMGDCFEAFEVRRACREFMDLARFANKYFNDKEPWRTRREAPGVCRTTLYLCLEALRTLAIVMHPLMPFSAEKLWRMLNLEGKVEEQSWDKAGELSLRPNHRIGDPEILFPKIPDNMIEEEIEKLNRIVEGETSPRAAVKPSLIGIDEFKRVDLRAAKILSAERVEKTEKLLKLQVEVGDEKRQIVAGIAQSYSPEDLVGKSIVLVANLEPAKIRGVESQGMLLATGEGDKIALVTFDREVESGGRVK